MKTFHVALCTDRLLLFCCIDSKANHAVVHAKEKNQPLLEILCFFSVVCLTKKVINCFISFFLRKNLCLLVNKGVDCRRSPN